MLKCRKITALVLSVLCATAFIGCGQTEQLRTVNEKRQLVFSVGSYLDDESIRKADQFADTVERLSGGNMTVNVIVGTPDTNTVTSGSCDFSLLRNVQLAQADPFFSMFSLPFIYDDGKHMSASLNSEEMRVRLEEKFEPENMRQLAAIYSGSSILVTSRGKIRKSADFQDIVLAVRTDNTEKITVFESLGARVFPCKEKSTAYMLGEEAIVPIKNPSGIKGKAIVDTVEVTYEQALQIAVDPYSLYVIKTNHTISPLWFVANEDMWHKLTKEEQAIIQEASAELVAELECIQEQEEEQDIEKLRDSGMTIVSVERERIALSLYGVEEIETERYNPPDFLDYRLYKLIQSFAE